MLRIGYSPFEWIGNPYTRRMISILSSYGRVEDLPRPKFSNLKLLFCRPYDFIFLNWIENGVVDSKSGRIRFFLFLRVLLKILYFRSISRKLIFVRHNNYPHAIVDEDANTAKKAVDLFERLCHQVVVHSGDPSHVGRVYLPHPLYVQEGQSDDACAVHQEIHDYFVVFGRIQPYKNLENLISIWPENVRLLIIGPADNEKYAKKLCELSAGKNVQIRAGYHPDEYVQEVIKRAAGVVVPHMGKDMIVSGSLIYSLSCGQRVLCRESDFSKWIASMFPSGDIFVYPDISSLVTDASAMSTEAEGSLIQRKSRVDQSFGDSVILRLIEERIILKGLK